MRRLIVPAIVIVAFLAGSRALPRTQSPAPAPAAERAFRQDQLEGADERVGSLAALALVQATVGTDPAREAWREQHRQFIHRQLDPSRFSGAVPGSPDPYGPAPRRIIEAIATFTASSGPPFTEIDSLLLGLLGRGPQSLRDAVVEALVGLIEWEARQGPAGSGRVVAAVEKHILHNPPQGEPVLADASRVLWRGDGKRFLSAAMTALEQNREKYPWSVDLYLRELRDRLRVDFPTPDDWSRWWESQKERSLAEIFADCQRQLSEDAARQWRQLLRRVRETQNAEQLRLALKEALEESSLADVRLAAVSALGDYAEWIRTVKLADEPGAAAADHRDRLLLQTFVLLIDVIQGRLHPHEQRRVRRAAFVALRSYKPFLDRHAELAQPISELVLESLQGALANGAYLQSAAERSDLLEVLRTAGALEVAAARDFVEDFVRSLVSAPRSDDLELLSTAAVALGRLVKGQLRLDTARLFIALFGTRADPAQPGTGLRELRRACVAALNARPEDEQVQDVVRDFYVRVLREGAEELRIPTILGLGTLAQGMDEGALEALVRVVEQPGVYRSQEITAAIDAIAYVGGRRALAQFLPLLGRREELLRNDPTVFAHLWRKVVGLVKLEGAVSLADVLETLGRLAAARDSVLYLECALLLCREAELQQLVSADDLDVGDAARLGALWRTAVLQARYAELVDEAGALPPVVKQLVTLQGKDPQVQAKVPREVAALDEYLQRRSRRDAVRARLATPSGDPMGVADELRTLVEPQAPQEQRWLALRWIERQLAADTFRAVDGAPAIHARWLEIVGSPAAEALFQDLPATFGKRYRERIEGLRPTKEPRKEAPPAPVATPPSPPSSGA